MLKISRQQKEHFRANGFLIVRDAISPQRINCLQERIARLFASDTRLIQKNDKWACWLSLNSLTGHQYMLNAWKGDELVAHTATDAVLGEAVADLGDWPGVRLALDTVWWKRPGARPVPFHQDAATVRMFLQPADFITCWVALDDVAEEIGSLQYAPGSHKWPVDESIGVGKQDHTEEDYRTHLFTAANRIGISRPEIVTVSGQAGMCSFHHGLLWHGSPANSSTDRPRRAYAILFVRMDSKFCGVPINPAFAYYKHPQSDELDERHFPVIWSRGGFA